MKNKQLIPNHKILNSWNVKFYYLKKLNIRQLVLTKGNYWVWWHGMPNPTLVKGRRNTRQRPKLNKP